MLLRQTFIGFYVYKAQLAERANVKMLLKGMFTHILHKCYKKRFYSHTVQCCSDKTDLFSFSEKKNSKCMCFFRYHANVKRHAVLFFLYQKGFHTLCAVLNALI